MNRVLILGGGPSGLMSAWAAMKNGWEVVLFDRHRPASRGANHGVFVLHDPLDIPSLPEVFLETTVMGIPATVDSREYAKHYSRKVYGNDTTPNSVVKYMNGKRVWNPVNAMSFAIDLLSVERASFFVEGELTKGMEQVNQLARNVEADAIISTVPLSLFAPEAPSEKVWVYSGEAPAHEAFMLYNLDPRVPWYRCSAVFGKFVMEYVPGYIPFANPGCTEVTKVLPWSPRVDAMRQLALAANRPILFTGRFGAWDKDVLVDTTYREAADWLCKLWT